MLMYGPRPLCHEGVHQDQKKQKSRRQRTVIRG